MTASFFVHHERRVTNLTVRFPVRSEGLGRARRWQCANEQFVTLLRFRPGNSSLGVDLKQAEGRSLQDQKQQTASAPRLEVECSRKPRRSEGQLTILPSK